VSARARVVLLVSAAVLALVGRAAAAVEVEARLARTRIGVGEATSLQVIVRGASGGVGEPEFIFPDEVEVLGSGRSQNFTWINGKSSVEIIYRYEIAASAAGRFSLGPIIVRAGKEVYRSGVLTLEASAAPTQVGGGGGGGGGSGAATLLVDVIPATPWQGQPCQLRVRLIQRAALAEDPQYSPPPTPGFWTGKPSPPESYYADERRRRVLVTETRTPLFPLASGPATVGEAVATLALAGGSSDPLSWLGGSAPRREEVVRSRPVTVHVRALPSGAPHGYTGAVGSLGVRWTADRPRTTVDVPVTVRLDVRGTGNLPLIRPPDLAGADIEVFASTVDDSLSGIAGDGSGRRRFQWTVLARRPGTLTLAPPPFAWFDPASGSYRRADLPALRLEVGPALFAGAGEEAALPAVFARHPIDPGARPARPWGWSLAGIMVATAVILWRSAAATPGWSAERARALEWLRAVGRATGPDFWRAADESSVWLEARGRPLGHLRREIAAARYAGAETDASSIRKRLVEHISSALPGGPAAAATGIRHALAVALVVLAGVCCVWTGPRAGDAKLRTAALAADRAARDGDMARARAGWARLWQSGARHPGLAARLAWVEAQAGAVGASAAWVVRGEDAGTRDAALGWVAERVREGGGLVGESRPRLPVRPLEWGILALLFGAVAGLMWPDRRPVAVAALALVALCGALEPLQSFLAARNARAVIVTPVAIEGEGLELQPGQVVRLREQRGGRARISAGAGVEGWIPAGAVDIATRPR
jgi:oxygen tolerance protein BatD